MPPKKVPSTLNPPSTKKAAKTPSNISVASSTADKPKPAGSKKIKKKGSSPKPPDGSTPPPENPEKPSEPAKKSAQEGIEKKEEGTPPPVGIKERLFGSFKKRGSTKVGDVNEEGGVRGDAPICDGDNKKKKIIVGVLILLILVILLAVIIAMLAIPGGEGGVTNITTTASTTPPPPTTPTMTTLFVPGLPQCSGTFPGIGNADLVGQYCKACFPTDYSLCTFDCCGHYYPAGSNERGDCIALCK